MTPRFSVERLQEFFERVPQAERLPPTGTATVSGMMVEDDLPWSNRHGITRLPPCHGRLRAGRINPGPDIRFGTLDSAAFGRDVTDYSHDDASVTNTGQFIVAIDIASFGALAHFSAVPASVADEITGSARRPAVDANRRPGERGLSVRNKRMAERSPIPAALLEKLDGIAAACGAPSLRVTRP